MTIEYIGFPNGVLVPGNDPAKATPTVLDLFSKAGDKWDELPEGRHLIGVPTDPSTMVVRSNGTGVVKKAGKPDIEVGSNNLGGGSVGAIDGRSLAIFGIYRWIPNK